MTRSPGYVLRVEPDALDLHRFERLVDEGRSLLARGLAVDASARLRDALSLWRGPALVDFAYESFAQTAIARLDEIRLAAVELRVDADLRSAATTDWSQSSRHWLPNTRFGSGCGCI